MEKNKLASKFSYPADSNPTHVDRKSRFDAWVTSAISQLARLADLRMEQSELENTPKKNRTLRPEAAKPAWRLQTFENRVPLAMLSQVQNDGTAAILITGDWWQGGHRTIAQLTDSRAVFAWHQIPSIWNWLKNHPSSSNDQPKEYVRSTQRSSFSSRSLICFSNDLEFRRSLVDAICAMNWSAIGLSSHSELPSCYPLSILCDDDSIAAQDKTSFYQCVRRAYAHSMIVAFQGFPRWEEAQQLVNAGADYVVGKLVDVPAVLDLAERFSSAALPRI